MNPRHSEASDLPPSEPIESHDTGVPESTGSRCVFFEVMLLCVLVPLLTLGARGGQGQELLPTLARARGPGAAVTESARGAGKRADSGW